MLRSATTRILDDADAADLAALLAADPVAQVFVAGRVAAGGVTSSRLGAQIWGYGAAGRLVAACYAGANLVPVVPPQLGPQLVHEVARAFADRARRQGRRCSSIVGPARDVLGLWHLLAPAWGPARDVRDDQPLLAIDSPPALAGDPAVRLVRPGELDLLFPAAVAMFTEEVGISPLAGGAGAAYRARLAELIRSERSYARIEDGRVLFKAEVGAVSTAACQIQGVWVAPDVRGRGLGAAGTAAVVADALDRLAPVVSLYVNSYNIAARRAYERVGFVPVGRFASVLF